MSTHRTSTNGGGVGPGRGYFQAKPIMGQIDVGVKGNWTSITAPPPEAWAAGVGGGGASEWFARADMPRSGASAGWGKATESDSSQGYT